MRATILPYVIILTKAGRVAVTLMAKRCIVALVLLIFTTQLYPCLCNSFHILTRGEYCNRNTPNPQHSPLLRSGG